MAGGLALKDYLLTLGLGFLSFAAGSVVVHKILSPDMSEPDLHGRLTAQRDAIKEVEQFSRKIDA